MKFGKHPARRLLKTLPLSNYANMGALAVPAVHAWERAIDYGMLGNDEVGDCAIAGFKHLEMNWQAVANAGTPYVVTTEQTLADYSAITGYNSADPTTDQGTDLITALNWYKTKGAIAGWASVDLQNVDLVKAACYVFGGLYIGFNVPQSMADEINNGIDPTWKYLPKDKASGEGHCVSPLGYGRSGFALCSWGKIYRPPWDFWMAWVDEAFALVSPLWLKQSGVSPTGLDINGLLADLEHA
jgi:hypothetical protein